MAHIDILCVFMRGVINTFMAQEIINTGALPNDGAGDPLRTAFGKINNNFAQLFSTNHNSLVSYTSGNTAQVIFQTPLVEFTQGKFQINTLDTSSDNSQDVTISAAVINNLSIVKLSAYVIMINDPSLTNFLMFVFDASSNVRLLVNSLTNVTMTHVV